MRAYVGLILLTAASGCEGQPAVVSPDHPMGLAAAALRDTAFTWQTRQTEHLRIHYQAESYAADHIDQFVQDAEQARENGLQVLGVKDFEPRIDVFHLKSREQMKRLTDYPVGVGQTQRPEPCSTSEAVRRIKANATRLRTCGSSGNLRWRAVQRLQYRRDHCVPRPAK